MEQTNQSTMKPGPEIVITPPENHSEKKEIPYSGSNYKLSREFTEKVLKLNPRISNTEIAINWTVLAGLITAFRFALPQEYFWWAWVPLIFIIAGRYGVFLQLIHEASHTLLHPNKDKNKFICNWFCAYPIGLTMEGYAAGHNDHHRFTNTEKDPPADTEKYRITSFKNPGLYALFLKDILGITALSVFFAYNKNEDEVIKKKHEADNGGLKEKLWSLTKIAFVQLIILGLLFQFNIVHYVLLWLFPAMGPHMFLMRIRGIAEHGLLRQKHMEAHRPADGTLHTRSFLTPQNQYKFIPFRWLERMLIGTCNVYYHHEHHLFPLVPYYNLPVVHQEISKRVVEYNPEVYFKGYFTAFLRNILSPRNR